jgi:hypothetical protein
MSKQEESHGGTASSGGSVSGISAIPWWLRAVVVVGALLMAAGGIIALVHPAMLVSPHDEINGAVHIYAGYLASRNLVLAMMLLATLVLEARLALGNLMVLTGFIQLVDACMDCVEGRWAVVPGVIVFGVVFFVGAARLCGYAFWKRQAWRQER